MMAVAAFAAGLLFAAGLIISGMTRPAYIVGFLDFFGVWKPALAFVMIGAVGVYGSIHRFVLRRRSPLFGTAFDLPAAKTVDARLVVGAAAFGVGWGLGGFCPGPAVVVLGTGAFEGLVFIAALLAGMALYHVATRGERASDGGDACG